MRAVLTLVPVGMVAGVSLAGCGETLAPAPGSCTAPAAPLHHVDYELQVVPDTLLWYRGTPLQDLDAYPQDEDGVILYDLDGRYIYHTIQVAQKGLRFAANYDRTGEPVYLERAVAHAARLLEDADTVDGALYFPYPFDFELHGNTGHVMADPWYSGMAQSQIMSLMLRLHELEGAPGYLEAAHRIMPTFERLPPDADPYTVRVDCEGYYWVEEYPREPSTQTLNGFIFGVWGLYDYWAATGDETAERLVKASLATLKRYLPDFRVAGEPSYYCLSHRAQIPNYHVTHIEQLLYLFRLSGDEYFRETLYQFAGDTGYEVPEWWW